jgi:hypothetical protein
MAKTPPTKEPVKKKTCHRLNSQTKSTFSVSNMLSMTMPQGLINGYTRAVTIQPEPKGLASLQNLASVKELTKSGKTAMSGLRSTKTTFSGSSKFFPNMTLPIFTMRTAGLNL